MKNRVKIILWLIVIILIMLTYFVFTKTLALFEDNAVGTADNTIGKWVIKINNQIISSQLVQNIAINSFVYDYDPKVESGYIAPGGSAYFDLIFDATECDVAVRYDISFDFSSMSYSDNISISVEEQEGNDTILTAEDTYSGVISLASILANKKVKLRVYVTWLDNEDYNEDDTALGTQLGSRLIIPITVHAEQYLGETLVPYVPEQQGEGD